MQRIIVVLLISILFLTACGQAPSATPTALVSAVEQATSTPSPLPTTPTASITPLPAIPTFTPTFDGSTILTVTPAPKAECPKEDSSLAPTFYVPKYPGCFDTDQCVSRGTEQEILKFLNKGGAIGSVISRLRTAIYGDYQEYVYQDVTGDQIAELMFIDFSTMGRLHILFCDEGSYQVFSSELDIEYTSVNQNIVVQDLNLDEIPEVIFLQGYANSCCDIHSFEWNGQTFQDLSPDAETGIGITIADVDQNGMKEIVATGIASLSGFYGIPYFGSSDFAIPEVRIFTRVYSWNGINFVFSSEKFEPPQYRFQAIQDADYDALKENYEQALLLYQDAISSRTLRWWSLAQYEFMKNTYYYSNVTSSPPPIEDHAEYPHLAAYAYYRIMLLHIVQGQESEATTTYTALQQTFGDDPYARPYVEMATAFRDAYQSTQKMYDGCTAAIQYAVEHPEILIPLGSDYHGAQSHIYKPEDVCPFR